MRAAQNELLTRVGPGTPGGELLRHYWQPAALVEELAPEATGGRPVKAVRLLGEDFVLFRDAQGRLGMLDRACPHRGADLSYGRREPEGLRCPFHGWLFDVDGRCLETPAEPVGSRLCQGIRQRSVPVVERAGVIWAYLGAGEPPAFPAFDCFTAPDAWSFAFKGLWHCNWLQALEVGIDPAHASYLHRFFEDEDTTTAYGRQFRAASSDSELPMTQVMREYARPTIEVESTEWGLQLTTLRRIDEARTHVRVTHQLFPNAFLIPLADDMTITQWHVPVDDTRNYWVSLFTSFGEPVDKATMRAQRLKMHTLPDYVPIHGAHDRYGFDAAEQASRTFTGMGFDINVHDQWAVESQGAIQDRTREHLGTSDRAIIAHRRALTRAIEAVQAGGRPPHLYDAAQAARLVGPATVDGIGPTGDADAVRAYWRGVDARRRARAPWAPRQAA